MCYQKVNQNWRKSNPLPSPVQSRFNPLHTVTPWTLQAPANNRPHSTSSQPPPTGTGAAKCISPSRSLHPAPGVQSSYHIFSFEIWSFKHLDLFLKIYYSLKRLATTVLTHICQGDFCQGHLYPIDFSNPWDFCHGMQLFQGKVDFQMEKLGLALELVVCFVFVFEHTDKPYCPFVEILSGILCSYQRWTQDVPSPWSLDFWNPSYGIKREGTFISWVWLGQNHFISCIWVFSNLTKAAYWIKKLKW